MAVKKKEVSIDLNQGEPNQMTSETNIEPQYNFSESIILHVGPKSNRSYFVRWYRYATKKDTVETPQRISTHFIYSNWRMYRQAAHA